MIHKNNNTNLATLVRERDALLVEIDRGIKQNLEITRVALFVRALNVAIDLVQSTKASAEQVSQEQKEKVRA